MGSSETEVNAFAVMPWTSPSRSTVMIVTPVVKAPIALRNSAGFKVIFVDRSIATSRSPHQVRCPRRLPSYISGGRNRLHYHGSPLYHSRQRGRNAHYVFRTTELRDKAGKAAPRASDLARECAAVHSLPRR